jgi:Tol biopolymer transport system component
MNKKKNLIMGIFLLAGVSFLFSSMIQQETAKELFERALYLEETKGDLEKAIGVYLRIVKEFPDERATAANAQLHIGLCYEKLGLKEAVKAFQKVVDNYPDQADAVKVAKDKLSLILKAKSVLDKGNSGFNLRKINDSSDVDPYGMSPDGRYISYTDWMGGLLGVYEIATGKKRYLDEKGSQIVLGSCWSPDGEWIAYNALNEEEFWDLRIIGHEGSEPRVLYKNKENFIHPVGWSPDGQYVLVSLGRTDGVKMFDQHIALVSVEDGSVDIVKTLDHADPTGAVGVVFSPEGRYLAYDFSPEKGSPFRDIFVISKDGKDEVSLIKHPADDYLLSWTPDGNSILFISDRRGTQDMWIIGIEEGKPKGEPVRIKSNMGSIRSLGFSKEGSFFYGLSTGQRDVFLAEIDAEKGVLTSYPRKVVKRNLGENCSPDWSPDGKYIAYVSKGRGINSLRVISIETDEEREVSRPDARAFAGISYALRWSPDSRSLLALGIDHEGNTNAYITDVSTGKSTTVKLEMSGEKLFHPAWSKDGNTIYYLDTSWKKNLTRIMAHDIETGHSREIANDSNNPLWLDISPDKKTLAYAVRNMEIKSMVLRTVSVSGGEIRDVARIPNKGKVHSLSWAPDGRSLYCDVSFWPESNKKEDGIEELWNFPVDGGDPKKLYEENEYGFSELRFHPDGKRFAFSMQNLCYEIWVMDNILPKTTSPKNPDN